MEDLTAVACRTVCVQPIYAGGLLAALRAAHLSAMHRGGIAENIIAPYHRLDARLSRGGEAGPAWSIPPVISYVSNAANLSLLSSIAPSTQIVGASSDCGHG